MTKEKYFFFSRKTQPNHAVTPKKIIVIEQDYRQICNNLYAQVRGDYKQTIILIII